MDLPADSIELQDLFIKYENWHEESYDPNMVIDECRPYASTSGRYPIWDDDFLAFDPFGYYA
eukprot:CAMPEP_0114587338 /NCGR_PEP_ID=MMETSP0125-20121206/10319_1 /TAXON_ID=485358 ORGANISM="Aristerostoma sp., Strain ATCC 50986" /NCGR_SAMPLE_ID=MMETSP0125 /ASSEMBLY_ACC=CAM_ASM_000245 /LENGTH=61 /DNA_ID=CAMNT_0001783191 /DNA_START=270 /DNA_END=455 /DNA_ORIENTATION=-